MKMNCFTNGIHRSHWGKKLLLLFLPWLSVAAVWGQAVQNPVMLPNGWQLTPAGKHIPLGDLPLNMALSPDGRWLAVTNNGYGRQCIQLMDVVHEKPCADVSISSSWYGLCFSNDNTRLYASAGNENKIKIFSVSDQGNLTLSDSIVMGKPWPEQISPAGIAMHPDQHQLYVVTRWDNSLYIYDTVSKELENKVPLGGEGYEVIFSRAGKYAYISCWGADEVLVWDVAGQQFIHRIPVGSHPNEICLDADDKRLFVANANDNTVSVVNLGTCRVEETLNAAIYHDALSGSTTNGLCLADHGRVLAVANADNNCVTLFDISRPGQSRAMGFIPVGWYPTNVKCTGNKLWVTNGKGLSSQANPEGPRPISRQQQFEHHKGDLNHTKNVQYIAGLFLGALSIIDMPDEAQLERYTRQVFDNTPFQMNRADQDCIEPGNPIPVDALQASPIKYVFYVIKENRSYDQVLGDLPEGNGDSTLTLFGRKVTPNQHKLAETFVLLDNFYVNAEVSCDGHNWTMGGYANDYLEKTWPTNYSGRGDVYSGEGGHHMGNNKTGFFWDLCQAHGVSYRSYGEFVNQTKAGVVATIPSLKGHFCPAFAPFTLDVRDTARINVWKADFDSLLAIGCVPRFNTIRIGNDHTEGMKLHRPTPYAHVADNDLAVGMLIDYLSHSPIWKETAVFIIEDDAQNGSDHVDAHRSTAYLAGGFVKRGFVDHTPYTTTSMLLTMERILGLPPMTQHDAGARLMWRCFTSEADTTSFDCLPAQVDMNELNRERNEWQAMCEKYDFTIEDNVPDVEFNQVLWYGLKGSLTPYPPLRRSAFLTYLSGDDDEDD